MLEGKPEPNKNVVKEETNDCQNATVRDCSVSSRYARELTEENLSQI